MFSYENGDCFHIKTAIWFSRCQVREISQKKWSKSGTLRCLAALSRGINISRLLISKFQLFLKDATVEDRPDDASQSGHSMLR